MWSQLLTLLGVALGACASYLFTARMERARNRREMIIRWDVRKYDAFCEYVASVTQMARTAGQLVGLRGWDRLAAKVDPDDGLRYLAQYEDARTVAYEKVIMLGDESCIRAAEGLNKAVWHLEWMARGADEGSPEKWKEKLRAYTGALDEFQRAARGCLAVQLIVFGRQIERPHEDF